MGIVAMLSPLPPENPPGEEEKEPNAEPMLYCPVCSMRLEQHKCKLICTRCGYYMSCADYY
jgi:hypothetical protein